MKRIDYDCRVAIIFKIEGVCNEVAICLECDDFRGSVLKREGVKVLGGSNARGNQRNDGMATRGAIYTKIDLHEKEPDTIGIAYNRASPDAVKHCMTS